MTLDGRILSGVTVLEAVVEAGSIVRAAEALGLSASAVSRALSRLEARVGVRLLDRTTRSLSLTDEGRRFREQVGPHLAGIEEAALEAAGAGVAVRGRLRVNTDPYLFRVALAGRIAEFLTQNPELTLELIARDSVGDLVADGFDVALRFGEPAMGSYVGRKLLETRILTVASPDYLDRHGRPKHPGEVADHVCIDFFDPVGRRAYDWEFRKGRQVLPVRTSRRFVVSDGNMALEACLAGAGLLQLLELGSRGPIESGRLVELFPEWSGEVFPLYALYPSRHYQPAKVRAFLDFCAQSVAGA